jgi:hypothetical protein
MQALIWSALRWVFREAVVKFVVLAAVFAVVSVFMPMAFGYVLPFLGTSALSNAFSRLPSGVWWGIDMFRLDYGLPLLLSAYIARFMIRRLPVVG